MQTTRQLRIKELKFIIGELEYQSNDEKLSIADRAGLRHELGARKLELLKVRRNRNSSRHYQFKPTLINRRKRMSGSKKRRRAAGMIHEIFREQRLGKLKDKQSNGL